MTTAAAPSEYGEPVSWEPDKPKFKPLRLLVSWFLTAIALLVAAIILPGVNIVDRWDALWMAAVVALLNALLPPLLAALRLPFMLGLGFILILILDALVLLAAASTHRPQLRGRQLRLGAAGGARRRRGERRARRSSSAPTTTTRTRSASSSGSPGARAARRDRRARDHLPRDRRPRAAGAAAGDARRQRAPHGALADRGHAPAGRVGDRPLLADRGEPGRDPARLERGHPGLPLGREGERAR